MKQIYKPVFDNSHQYLTIHDWSISVLTLNNIPHDLPTIFLYKNRMETILHFKRILSGINLLALAIRRTHILRFTTHSWRQSWQTKGSNEADNLQVKRFITV